MICQPAAKAPSQLSDNLAWHSQWAAQLLKLPVFSFDALFLPVETEEWQAYLRQSPKLSWCALLHLNKASDADGSCKPDKHIQTTHPVLVLKVLPQNFCDKGPCSTYPVKPLAFLRTMLNVLPVSLMPNKPSSPPSPPGPTCPSSYQAQKAPPCSALPFAMLCTQQTICSGMLGTPVEHRLVPQFTMPRRHLTVVHCRSQPAVSIATYQ